MVSDERFENRNKIIQSKDHWNRIDKRILIFFGIWFIMAIIITLVVGYVIGFSQVNELITIFIVFTIGAFFMTGFLAFIYYGKTKIISTKRVMIWLLKISLIIGLVFAVVLLLYVISQEVEDISSIEMVFMFIALYIGGISVSLITFFMFFFFGFGLMSFLSVFIRRKTPDFLVEITKITPNTSDSAKKRDKKTYRGYKWLAWAFGIPDVLDTRTLTINEIKRRHKFPWSAFKKAMFWQLFFSLVIVVYISFSPFLWDFADMQDLFGNSSTGTAFIPFLIIPWFIYLRLDVKIKGPVKDFHVFDGLSSRMFQTIVAFGTILLLIRMALKNPAILQVMYSFVIFFIFFFAGIFIVTFVYFNYFEDDLAQDISRRYKELKKKGVKK